MNCFEVRSNPGDDIYLLSGSLKDEMEDAITGCMDSIGVHMTYKTFNS